MCQHVNLGKNIKADSYVCALFISRIDAWPHELGIDCVSANITDYVGNYWTSRRACGSVMPFI